MTTLNVTTVQRCGRSFGDHHQQRGKDRDPDYRGKHARVKLVHDHLVYVEPYTGTVVDAPDDAP